MNEIIEVSEEHAYAIVEPGVSFFVLYNYIQKKGYRLWPPFPALGWGSVLGNTLERGFGYTPNGEHAEQQCGMEVVLGTGEVVRTGMGALPGSPMWPLFKGGYGLSIDGLFYQSNLGIVTKLWEDGCTSSDLVSRVLGPGLQSGSCATNADMTAAKERGWGHWTGDFALYAASPAILDANLRNGCTL
ncbi:hypothetical protein N0V85_002092 [Neurospora sp. IMI 360204]|nr:hypothetical protein N0V85_002092 [Neurospora sp. IMI 360204]